jgi:hypothetical protein
LIHQADGMGWHDNPTAGNTSHGVTVPHIRTRQLPSGQIIEEVVEYSRGMPGGMSGHSVPLLTSPRVHPMGTGPAPGLAPNVTAPNPAADSPGVILPNSVAPAPNAGTNPGAIPSQSGPVPGESQPGESPEPLFGEPLNEDPSTAEPPSGSNLEPHSIDR